MHKALIYKLINWHQKKHPNVVNMPNKESLEALTKLCDEILLPIENAFGEVKITYGFTSYELMKKIQRQSPQNTAPRLDQHISCELNQKGDFVCKRLGAACDFKVNAPSNIVLKWIAENIEFDRLYFYGNELPIHISWGPQASDYIQLMKSNSDGQRYPSSKGTRKDIERLIGKLNEC